MLQVAAFEEWLGWPGIIIGLILILGSLEFIFWSGRHRAQ
jgi:hypothetical protein